MKKLILIALVGLASCQERQSIPSKPTPKPCPDTLTLRESFESGLQACRDKGWCDTCLIICDTTGCDYRYRNGVWVRHDLTF